MKKILLCILLFFLFQGNIIIQAGAIATIIIIFTQSIKKKAKSYSKTLSKKNIEYNCINDDEKRNEMNYLKELKAELTQPEITSKPKTYKKSKV